MSDNAYFKFTNSVVVAPLLAILSIWTVFWVELRFKVNLNDYGIYPQRVSGLKGIIFSPFIHGSVEHLYNNTIPLAVLTASLFYFYRGIALRVLVMGILISGLFTWAIGRPSYHIGASGVIYLLASFIFFKGIFTKHYRLVALSLIVVFIYGSMLWYIFPIEDGISWEGHLGGFLGGLLLAFVLKSEIPPVKKYDWEKEDYDEEADEFLRQFDEYGNFIEKAPEQEVPEDTVKVTYHYKEQKPDDFSGEASK
ncbi:MULTISPECIES: rhomboid family intramembrane serine protease [Zobellia]|uniref:Rhomboid-like protease, family S54 n=1 Tax=Zobellia galactanivorans (strain DSM 12802 / CCUG 47099 / CIP 106680 / NCIMB 13871 / Dsij) TaxID=63186 RepID=G0L610_ZOBGA|nr:MULTISPECIES: rhomboid family intramembrane serine protease [Zobellia]OWW24009.1 rhomboid family intramembrane serine protease [Zobellia sp. OII3]CAZ96645.1 Rhomboid-like protease, family S54 [Zobellia galactanivorans]